MTGVTPPWHKYFECYFYFLKNWNTAIVWDFFQYILKYGISAAAAPPILSGMSGGSLPIVRNEPSQDRHEAPVNKAFFVLFLFIELQVLSISSYP